MVFCIIVLKPRDIWKYVRVIGVVVYVKDIRDDVLELCAEPVGSWRGCVILPTHLQDVGFGLFYVYIFGFFYILFIDECWIDRVWMVYPHESLRFHIRYDIGC